MLNALYTQCSFLFPFVSWINGGFFSSRWLLMFVFILNVMKESLCCIIFDAKSWKGTGCAQALCGLQAEQ